MSGFANPLPPAIYLSLKTPPNPNDPMRALIPPTSRVPFHRRPVHRKAWLQFLIALLLALPIVAQEQAEPAPNFQVLKRTEIKRGDHSIIFQQVVPPQATAPAAPVPPVKAPDLSPQELEAQRRREAKQQRVLFFSATVFDHKLTELSWTEESGTYRAFSNIDFQVFSGMGEIETADAIYTLMLALDTGTPEALAERTRAFPQTALLPKDRSAWLLVEGPGRESTPVVAALDAIHPFYDAHRDELIRARGQRAAASAERERQLRENPPVKKDTVISYWRKPVPAAQPQNPGAPK